MQMRVKYAKSTETRISYNRIQWLARRMTRNTSIIHKITTTVIEQELIVKSKLYFHTNFSRHCPISKYMQYLSQYRGKVFEELRTKKDWSVGICWLIPKTIHWSEIRPVPADVDSSMGRLIVNKSIHRSISVKPFFYMWLLSAAIA